MKSGEDLDRNHAERSRACDQTGCRASLAAEIAVHGNLPCNRRTDRRQKTKDARYAARSTPSHIGRPGQVGSLFNDSYVKIDGSIVLGDLHNHR